MSNPLHAFFVKIPLFSGLSTEELEDIVRIVRPVNVAEGQILFAEGAPGDAAYVIQSGLIEVFRKVEGKEVALQRFGPYEVFGELALLDGEPRSAGCRVLEAATLLRIDKAEFDFLRKHLRPAAYVVIRSIAQVTALLAPEPEPEEKTSKGSLLRRLLGGEGRTPGASRPPRGDR